MRMVSQIVAIMTAAWLPPPAVTGSAALAQGSYVSEAGFQAYLPTLRAQARSAGVSEGTINRIFPTLQFSRRTIELDRPQAPSASGSRYIEPFQPYYQRHVTSSLISRGRDRYAGNISRLNEIGRRYGVQPSVLVAIWGKETSYGSITGDFDLLNSLASLAYEGRRRQLFTEEFIATLKLVDRGYSRSQLKGSWAGATGYPQFLPSVFLRLGVDGDGDGRSNIWTSQTDALASIANYLSNAGWKPNVPWGVPVSVPSGFNRNSLTTRLVSPRCTRVFERHSQWRTMGEWRRMGFVAQNGRWPADNEMATLLEPDGPGRTAYLLTNNYRAILDYNCSNFYALTVGLLADQIAR
ncbi:MAG TPA: lytic murein transglycosylase [Allosphingosinicella sp.]|uniref:lytic murein transglycosylase n=1 Tax=Allosphingosinicella sp. TaxID=2823234 RepID=UPI002EDAAE74